MMEAKRNLLQINRNALRFLHDAEGFDFEKPHFIYEQSGRFTVNTVKKTVEKDIAPAQSLIALLIVPTEGGCKHGLYFATLDGAKFDGTRKSGADYWNFRTITHGRNIDYCWGVGDFEDLRKNQTDKVFIIAQDAANITPATKKKIDFSARYVVTGTTPGSDGHGARWVSQIDLLSTDGSGARFTYKPYGRYYNPREKRSDVLTDYIDKNGYIIADMREDLIRRAEKLRADRAKLEASTADYSATTAELQNMIDETRRHLSGLALDCTTSEAAADLSKRFDRLRWVLFEFSLYVDRLENKKYSSVSRINSDVDAMKNKLNFCLGGAIND
jgi:hypothetical protein